MFLYPLVSHYFTSFSDDECYARWNRILSWVPGSMLNIFTWVFHLLLVTIFKSRCVVITMNRKANWGLVRLKLFFQSHIAKVESEFEPSTLIFKIKCLYFPNSLQIFKSNFSLTSNLWYLVFLDGKKFSLRKDIL